MTRNTVMESILIQMADPTKDNGQMESSTEKDFSSHHKELKEKEFGTRVKE